MRKKKEKKKNLERILKQLRARRKRKGEKIMVRKKKRKERERKCYAYYYMPCSTLIFSEFLFGVQDGTRKTNPVINCYYHSRS